MHTPWGEIEVVDSHAHLFSHSFFQALATQKGRTDDVDAVIRELGWERPPKENRLLARRWAEELDSHGVCRSVLMASLPGDEASAAEVVATYPDRFYGYFMCNPLAPDAVDRARSCLDELGLRGLCLFPSMHRFSVQNEDLRPIYELIEARDNVLIFVHMGVLTVGVRRKLGLPSPFDVSFSNPLDLHRVAMEYPKVNFVIPHFGSGFFREVLMLGDLAENIFLDTSSSNSWTKYLTPKLTLQEVFSQALEIYGPERLLFGTDSSFFPRGWNRPVLDAQTQVLQKLGVDEEAARAILGGNLKRLLGE
jgi:predicted TIM-barrel fold metal-dependent hydrolase